MSDSPDITLERSIFYGTIFMSLCYGLSVYIYFHSLSHFLHASKTLRPQYRLYLVLGTVSLAVLTIAVFTNVVLAEFMWIDHRDVVGGPLGYLATSTSLWWQVLGTASDQLANFIGDGLLIYRCYIIWQSNWMVVIFPGLLYLGSIAMALITLVQSAVPGNNFFQSIVVNFGVPWVALSVAINVYVAIMITTRLLKAKQELKNILPEEVLNVYTGYTAIIVESCMPFSILGIPLAVTYGKNIDVAPAFLFIWGVFVTLAPQFIIYRVMSGNSWTRDIISEATNGNIQASLNNRGRMEVRNGSTKTYVNDRQNSASDANSIEKDEISDSERAANMV